MPETRIKPERLMPAEAVPTPIQRGW